MIPMKNRRLCLGYQHKPLVHKGSSENSLRIYHRLIGKKPECGAIWGVLNFTNRCVLGINKGSMCRMMDAEGRSRLDGPAASTNNSITQELAGHTMTGFGVLNGDLEGLLGWKDMAKQRLFVYLKCCRHVLHETAPMTEECCFQTFPEEAIYLVFMGHLSDA